LRTLPGRGDDKHPLTLPCRSSPLECRAVRSCSSEICRLSLTSCAGPGGTTVLARGDDPPEPPDHGGLPPPRTPWPPSRPPRAIATHRVKPSRPTDGVYSVSSATRRSR